jgi:hypothetical protein
VEERELVGVFIGLQGSFMHQAANGEVRHQQTEKLLLDQLRRLAAQHDLSSAKMCFQLVQRSFDFPPLMIERRQFFGGGLLVIQDGGDEAVQP